MTGRNRHSALREPAGREIHDRLEVDLVVVLQAEEVVERLRLDRLRRLRHPDAVGNARVPGPRRRAPPRTAPTATRRRPSPARTHTRGSARATSDREGIRQLVGASDEAGPCLDLDLAAVRNACRERVHEPQVAGPDEALFGLVATRDEAHEIHATPGRPTAARVNARRTRRASRGRPTESDSPVAGPIRPGRADRAQAIRSPARTGMSSSSPAERADRPSAGRTRTRADRRS